MVPPEEPPSRNKKHAAPFIGRRVAVHANALGLASAVSAQRVHGDGISAGSAQGLG